MSQPDIKAIIGKVDADGNGFIDPQEFKTLAKEANEKFGTTMTEEQCEKAINAMDKDKDGMINIKEAIDYMVTGGFLPKMQGLGFWGDLFKAVSSAIPAIVDAFD